MGLMDKFKKILFDEEVVDVPVNTDELPNNAPKENMKKELEKVTKGFKDYNGNDDDEDDTITEVKIPLEPMKEGKREIEAVKEDLDIEKKGFNLPIDFDMKEDPLARKRSYEETDEFAIDSYNDELELDDDYSKVEPRRDYHDLSRVMENSRRHEEIKDYKKIVSEREETTVKKPFRVTPIISPVFGILDKNYTPDEVVERREQINRVNNSVSKERTYGPVCYNDQPLPTVKYGKRDNLKEELVELNTTINEMMNESTEIDDSTTREIEFTKTELKVTKQAPVEEDIVMPAMNEAAEEIIVTPNYDEYETTSIEQEYLGNNSIEDAFETTTEFKKINDLDTQEESSSATSIEEIINNVENYEDGENHLEDTIETDLFNLIDSMYKKDDDELEDDSEE